MYQATPPKPDPYPVPGPKVTIVAYDYDTPAMNKATGKRIPHLWFRCHVTVNDTRHCVKFTR